MQETNIVIAHIWNGFLQPIYPMISSDPSYTSSFSNSIHIPLLLQICLAHICSSSLTHCYQHVRLIFSISLYSSSFSAAYWSLSQDLVGIIWLSPFFYLPCAAIYTSHREKFTYEIWHPGLILTLFCLCDMHMPSKCMRKTEYRKCPLLILLYQAKGQIGLCIFNENLN